MCVANFASAANVTQKFEVIATTAEFTFSATTTSQMVLGVNLSRGYLMVQNSCASTANVSVNLRSQETAGTGIQIAPCGAYEFASTPTNSVWIKSASGTQTVIFIEGTAQ